MGEGQNLLDAEQPFLNFPFALQNPRPRGAGAGEGLRFPAGESMTVFIERMGGEELTGSLRRILFQRGV